MDTLENSNLCRLCGKTSGISINIFDKKEKHSKKINSCLPVLVHQMDMLPKSMCHRCSYKLEEFYNFYVLCAKTDSDLKSQLSWMKKGNMQEKVQVPMVKLKRFKIKTEPSGHDQIISLTDITLSNRSSTVPSLQNNTIDTLKTVSEVSTPLQFSKEYHKNVTFASDLSLIEGNDNQAKGTITPNGTRYNHIEEDIYCSSISDHEYSKSPARSPKKNKLLGEKKNKSRNVNSLNGENSNNLIDRKLDSSKKLHKNRELRPRRLSVDYSLKKKLVTSNLSVRLTRSEVLDSKLVKQPSLNVSTPIIKLEKLDEPIKVSRKRKIDINQKILNSTNSDIIGNSNFYNSDHVKTLTNLGDQIINPFGLKIKQEVVNEILETDNTSGNSNFDIANTNQFSSCDSDSNQDKLVPIVKLEKDYTCNVNYPKLKIKKHLTTKTAVNNPDKDSTKSGILQVSLLRQVFSKNKALESDDIKLNNIDEKSKKSLKKRKRKNKNRSDKTKSVNSSPFLLQTDFKRYCEDCNVSFKTKELYKLHPCYQR